MCECVRVIDKERSRVFASTALALAVVWTAMYLTYYSGYLTGVHESLSPPCRRHTSSKNVWRSHWVFRGGTTDVCILDSFRSMRCLFCILYTRGNSRSTTKSSSWKWRNTSFLKQIDSTTKTSLQVEVFSHFVRFQVKLVSPPQFSCNTCSLV